MKQKIVKRLLATVITATMVAQSMDGGLAYAVQDSAYPCGYLEITYSITGEWDNHQNVQLCISNPTNSPVYRWAFQYDAGGMITEIWNASVVESKDNMYVIENKGYNNYLAPHSTQQIGYIVEYNDTKPEITDYTNCIEKISTNTGFETETAIQVNPESGNGVVSITNTSENPIYGWELSFKSDTLIESCYDAKLLKEADNSYVISCENWNAIILPGDTLNLGVSAEFTNITDFQITDTVLASDVLSYSLNVNPNSPLQIEGFSEYGVNVLNWNYDKDATFDIFRQSDGDFTYMDSIWNEMYYLDTDAEPGVSYKYYVVAHGPEEEDVQSNTVGMKTTVIPDGPEVDTPQWVIDMMLLDDDYSALQIGYVAGDSRKYVSKQLTLPTNGENGSSVSWKSSNPQVISESGDVTAPYSECFTPVTMTAFLSLGKFTVAKSFELSVAPNSNIEQTAKLTSEDLMALNGGNMPSMTYSATNGNVSKIEGVCSSIPVFNSESATVVLNSLSDILGITEPETQTAFVSYQNTPANNVFSFRQFYEGIPVIGYTISLFADPTTGTVRRVTNQFHPQLELSTIIPEITADEAAEIAAAQFSAEITDFPKLVIYYPYVEDNIADPMLTWMLGTDSTEAQDVFIDAITGNVLETCGSKTAAKTYKETNALLKTEVTVNTESDFKISPFPPHTDYYLYDKERGLRLYDGTNHTSEDDWVAYVRDDNDWSDATYDNAIAAEYNVAKTYDFFHKTFGWEGFDNNGGNTEMKIGVNYASQNNDGTINTTVSNAFSSYSTLGFGSGNGTSTVCFAASLDCVAHEFTHSVTQKYFTDKFNADIYYEGESGAVNEAYSDIFGEFTDSKYDWIHGTEYRTNGTAGRDLASPTNNYYHGSNWTDTTDFSIDKGGVHDNSTVLSHAAYLMTIYDSATGLTGIPKSAMEKIWFESYEHYDSRYPTFLKCREAVEDSVDDIYGENSIYAKKVRSAFDAVGIQKSDITVRVEDALTGNPVKNAFIHLSSPCYTYNLDFAQINFGNTDSFGEAHFSDVINNKELIFEVSNSSYEKLTHTVTADTAVRYYTLSIETPYTKTLKGTITIADTDTDMTNNVPLDNCNLMLTKLTGMGNLNGSSNFIFSSTDDDGKYEFTNIPSGIYDLRISKHGYIEVHQKITVKSAVTNHNIAIELIPGTFAGKGFASGSITDARTGAKIPNLTLNVYPGIHIGTNEPSADTIKCSLTTDVNGNYLTTELDAGNYTVFVIDNRETVDASERYLITSFPIKILGNQMIANQNGTVSQTLNNDQLRIVLTWGSNPRDLDSHTIIYSNSGTKIGHVYYTEKVYKNSSGIVTDLDLDDTSSYGPETTTVYIPDNNRYVFYVHDYTNRTSGMSNTALSNSGARVYVYAGNSSMPIEVYSVPLGTGTYWKVFSYDSSTQEIISYNTLSTYMT